ncbi:unnamed protein product [Owenia fusiformis]|uniref:Flavin-containing monooxygenase n=1 Tax=Owenia fusiformis TaxID=6347 RepID=A0A8J1TLB6_OWEFU|nr:unnamed protein product [Owenia fusiformis]
MSDSKRVAIIGAGASGLAAIKACLDEGLKPVCFERDGSIGGLWNYTSETTPDHASVYKSCTINTSKEMMAFSDFPVPAYFPANMPHNYVLEYFKMYAEKFQLLPYINFNRTVDSVRPADDFKATGRWKVTTRNSDAAEFESKTEEYDGVMVCSGHHCIPHRPHFPGIGRFRGHVIHSQQYKTPDIFTDKKVLIIGMGNSAVDIAVDASHVADETYVSTRRGAWVISRMGPLGYPADMLANSRAMFSMPMQSLEWMVEKMAQFKFSHEMYGVKPNHGALQAHPTINDELPHRIVSGKVRIRPNIDHFTENSVVFEDGTEIEADVVVMATGYHYEFRFIDEKVLKVERNETSLYKYVFPPHLKHPTLGIIGLVQAIGAAMPIAEIQSRWVTRIIKGDNSLPSMEVMFHDIVRKKRSMSSQYTPSQRHTLQTFWIKYMDEIANEIGCKPDLKRMFLEDPMFAFRCWAGPCVPAQYRLCGPGAKFETAKETVMNAFQNIRDSFNTRQKPIPIAKTQMSFVKRDFTKITPPLFKQMVLPPAFRGKTTEERQCRDLMKLIRASKMATAMELETYSTLEQQHMDTRHETLIRKQCRQFENSPLVSTKKSDSATSYVLLLACLTSIFVSALFNLLFRF